MSQDNWTGNWPIERALARIANDMRSLIREEFRNGGIGQPYFYEVAGDTPETRKAYEIGLRNGYEMSRMYISSINEVRPPDPPTPYNDLIRITRKARNRIHDMIRDASAHLEYLMYDVADFVRAPNEHEEE